MFEMNQWPSERHILLRSPNTKDFNPRENQFWGVLLIKKYKQEVPRTNEKVSTFYDLFLRLEDLHSVQNKSWVHFRLMNQAIVVN